MCAVCVVCVVCVVCGWVYPAVAGGVPEAGHTPRPLIAGSIAVRPDVGHLGQRDVDGRDLRGSTQVSMLLMSHWLRVDFAEGFC